MKTTTHSMDLTPKNFDAIKSGQKHFEFRLNDDKRRQVEVGDLIEFSRLPDKSESLIVRVINKHVYASFEALYDALKDQVAEIAAWSKEDFLLGMGKYYADDEQWTYGVVAIELQLLG